MATSTQDVTVRNSSLESVLDDGTVLGVSLIEALLLAIPCSTIMLFTIVGNILVIVSIFNYKPLRNVQNMYLVSLAVADITVAMFVMPFNVTYSIMGRWIFGLEMCKVWLTSDVLCCTASILNLCAIALDRYQAIHDPINYAQKRTLQRVLSMIAFIWIISAIISIPPLLGWNDWPQDMTESCALTQEKTYVIYSSFGSFFIPLIIMSIVYAKIFMATRRRLREKAKLATHVSVKVKRPVIPSSSGDGEPHASTSSDNAVTDCNHTGIGNNNSSSVMRSEYTVENSDSSQESESCVTDYSRSTSAITSSSRNCVNEHDLESNSNAICETNFSVVKKGPSPMLLKPESARVKSGRHHKKKGKGNSSKKKSGHQEPTSQVKQYWEEKQRISLSRERKAARVLGIVMGVFGVCWLPFFVMYVVVPFCGEEKCPVPRWLENFITWLGYINSALNPIIYTIFNMDFRKAFTRILCCDRGRGRGSQVRRR